MDKYYKIVVYLFDRYDFCKDNTLWMNRKESEVVIAKKEKNGYKEIVTNHFIPIKNIIDVEGPKKYDSFLGVYYTKKGIINELLKEGYLFGVDIDFYQPIEVKTLKEIKEYLYYYDINKFPNMIQKIECIKYQQQNNQIVTNNLVTEENVKKLVKEYKYGKEE